MKKELVIFAVSLLVTVMLSSCKSKEEKVLDQLNDLTEQIEKKSDKWTSEDWQKAFKKVEDIHNEISECDFSKEQLKGLGEAEGRLSAAMIKSGVSSLNQGIGSFFEKAGSFVGGFQEGVQDNVSEDELEEVSNYVNSALELLKEQGADD